MTFATRLGTRASLRSCAALVVLLAAVASIPVRVCAESVPPVEGRAHEGDEGAVAVRCPVPAAEVWLDGRSVGRTPLSAPLVVPVGKHRIEVRRPGYVTAGKTVTIERRARTSLDLELLVDGAQVQELGALNIRISEEESSVFLDGAALGTVHRVLEVPRGPHRLRVERPGFEPYDALFEMQLPETAQRVVLLPTADTREEYMRAAFRQRTWGLSMLVGTAVFVSVGTVFAGVGLNNHAVAQRRSSAIYDKCTHGQGCDFFGLDRADGEANDGSTMATGGFVMLGLGAAFAAAGTTLVLLAGDPYKYDRRARSSALVPMPYVDPRGGAGISVRFAF